MRAPGRPHTDSFTVSLQKLYCLSSNLARFPNYQQAVRGSWSFLMALSASLPKYTISNSSLPSTCAQGAVSAPGHYSLCWAYAQTTETQKSWYSSSKFTSEPESLCPGSRGPKKALAVVAWGVRFWRGISGLWTLPTKLDKRTGPAPWPNKLICLPTHFAFFFFFFLPADHCTAVKSLVKTSPQQV